MRTSPDAMVGFDQKGSIRFVNHHTELLFGYDRGDLVGKSIGTLVPESFRKGRPPNPAYFSAPRTRARAPGVELTGRRRNGAEFPVDVTLSLVDSEIGLLVTAAVRDATERDREYQDLQRMAAIVASSDDAIIAKTLDGVITSWNPAAERIYGYLSEEIVGRSIETLASADRTSEIKAILTEVKAGRSVDHFETTRVRKDGTPITVSISVSPIHDETGAIVGASTIARKLSRPRKAAKVTPSLVSAQGLGAAESLAQTVIQTASVGCALTDLDGSFRVVNGSLCDLLGYDGAWFLAHRVQDLIKPDDLAGARRERAQLVEKSPEMSQGPSPGVAIVRLVRADRATVWVRRVGVLIRDEDGQPSRLMFQFEDITADHEAHEALAHQALHDPLTGLPNRAWILDILEVNLPSAKRQGSSLGALFIDLDNFKIVNDSLGHAAGDEVLAAVADRIVRALRPGDRVGRFGGDEFVLVVQDVRDILDLERHAERVSASITPELRVRGHRIVPTASIGIAVSTPLSTPDSLLRDADSALFRAKAAGRGRWQFFDAAMHAQAVARLTLEEQLRDAITRGEFVVHYQPIVSLADGQVVGHEALLRWDHPTRGLLSPAEFLEVAEDTGLINEIGALVLDQVCATLADRLDLPGTISVNISPIQLAAHDWHEGFRNTLRRHQVDPARIVIEVTETTILSLVESARRSLTYLHRLGVGILIDDFGTGHSCLSVIRDLPVSGVKLDLVFVQELTDGQSRANALAEGLSGLVNGVHLTGIAEGVETQTQADILRAQGWQYAQGYYFGVPDVTPGPTQG